MSDKEILSSVYNFLLQQGHKTAAKALLKDAGTDEVKIKSVKHEKLEDLFAK